MIPWYREVSPFKLDGKKNGRHFTFHNKLALTIDTRPDNTLELTLGGQQYRLVSALTANPRGTNEQYPVATMMSVSRL